jgi:hypothetical protein
MAVNGPFADLPENLPTNEMAKFELDENGYVRIRTSATGSFTFNGLKLGGKVTITSINSTTWTKIVASPLTSCNQINIQNESGQLVKLNYIQPVAFEGVYLKDGMERQYSIQGNIVIYARCESGTASIVVEEIA